MQSKQGAPPVGTGKKIILAVLFFTAGAICASGVFFSVYSYLNGVSLQVMNTRVSGIVFGAVVFYLGVRYIVSLFSLKAELYEPTSRFSWDHFKKKKQ
ncbi:hypothetical protein [Caproiciproducens faecalis]|uniref:hypothetical protein n=1 Tax=Caproiciproducens faecalis TaxID=2820301 RepID=UPI002104862E|nr:hypothetical protein [Caproiciproducens faecalis]